MLVKSAVVEYFDCVVECTRLELIRLKWTRRTIAFAQAVCHRGVAVADGTPTR